MMGTIAWLISASALFVAILFTFLEERALWRQRRAARSNYKALQRAEVLEISQADGHTRGYRPTRRPEAPPEPIVWTPEEREAFGFNELEAWIAATDRILNQIDWDRRKAKMTPPTTSVMTKEDDQVVVAHVYAWGEEKPVRSITTPTRRNPA